MKKDVNVLETIGRGLVAGLAGTIAITASTMIEARLRGRPESTTPSKVGGKVLGVRPRNRAGQKRFNNIVHWDYGMSWGLFLALAEDLGLTGLPASVAHFSAVWGTALVMLPAADASKPVTEWEPQDIAIDVMHHAVYAAVAGLVYELLAPKEERAEEPEDERPEGTYRFPKHLLASEL